MKKLMAIFAVIALVAFAAPAFAANPFMDVPAGHWAYDAVDQLAARGVISGYPDGAYKGGQPSTRYEMASIVARALAVTDMQKFNKQDAELLKKLVLEFKNELDALGVKVADLDKRVSVLEDNIGGWHVRGIFRFDARFGDSDSDKYEFTGGKEKQFTKERFRLFLTKTIDENTYFYAQYRTAGGGTQGMGAAENTKWSDLYVDTKLPWDINFRVGRFAVDFEDDYGLYTDLDAAFGDFGIDGFRLKKDFGVLTATAVVGRNTYYDEEVMDLELGAQMTYVLDLNFRPSEKFFVGATGYWMHEDAAAVPGDYDVNTYGIYGGYNFTPGLALKGIYYFQDLGEDIAGGYDDSPNSWKAILDVKQEVLKFTSLWVEYGQEDNTFVGIKDRYGIGGSNYAYVGRNQPMNDEKTKFIFATAKQQWNDKFSTFLRYAHADFDTDGLDDASEWGIGVGYQYTPAIYFELMYDQVDYGNNNATAYPNASNEKESVVRLRTTVRF